ncbi:MAG: molecular chaperone DnaJ [Nitrosomonas sp.]|nr:molecular chaperone DnaJ [Nitrosomonas sp.]
MSTQNQTAVQIRQAAKQKTLSTAQKKFNSLIRKIEKEKERLQGWQALKPDFQKKLFEEYQPLVQTFVDLQTALVKRLDEFHNRRGFTPPQQNKISYAICELCLILLNHSNADDVKAIYEKHSCIEFDDESEELNDMMSDLMKDIIEEQFGDLGDDFDYTDPQAVAQRVAKKLQDNEETKSLHRNKTKQQSKRQAAQEECRTAAQKAEQKNISQSIKTIYRQLITAAHPDRETDPVERDRKTVIMQQVNAAYEKKDLLKLLALQLELEQIDQNHINEIAEDRLKSYNKILQGQLEQLRIEVEQEELPFRMSASLLQYETINPEKVVRHLNADIQEMTQNIAQLEKELKFLTTVKNVKVWLKDCGLPEDVVLSGSLFDDMDDFDFR